MGDAESWLKVLVPPHDTPPSLKGVGRKRMVNDMDWRFFFKLILCAIQLVLLYQVLVHEKDWLTSFQALIVIALAVI